MGLPASDTPDSVTNHISLNGLDIQLSKVGNGPPLLYLHSHLGFWREEAFIDALSRNFTVILPAHPGFEGSATSPDLTTVDDLGYFYLDLVAQLGLKDIFVVGSSLGAWVALSLAVKDCSWIRSLVLLNPVGIHQGTPEDESVADIFSLDEESFARKGFINPDLGRKDFPNMSDGELLISARNREAAARYAWTPCFYDPKLPSRLHRITRPVHVICGKADQLTAPGYGRSLADLLPQSDYQEIAEAGHFPSIERPAETAHAISTVLKVVG